MNVVIEYYYPTIAHIWTPS